MSSPNYDVLLYLKIPLADILKATNNFSEKNKVETANFGNEYQGQLLWSGELIKIFARRYNKEWSQREQEFQMEVFMLSTLKHKNLVSLVGFCDENHEKIIIIKFESRCSLDNYLSDAMMLTWVRRLEICVGLANALSYIHYDEEHEFSVIHRNIDSLNVLLNEDYEPKLSEFRLSMKIEASQRHHSFHVDKVWDMEGQGYTDPTYIETKMANHKSDMYSFGIVMFELLCGRKSVIANDTNKYLAPLAITHYKEKRLEDIIDWDLQQQMDSESFSIFAETAYECLNEERSQRPSIDEIVPKLEKALKHALENKPIMSLPRNQFAHLKVPLESIISATNNFDEQNAIKYTGFAKEYKGQLLWSGELIDISAKRFNKEMDDKELFWTEISLLSTLKHKNVVSLVGFCDENNEKVIIIRNETRGMLSDYLSDPMLLTWVRRLEICVGLAHALSYIHYDEPRDFSVIHRLIGRVLLNDDWEPKLYGFEYSMKIKASQRHHSFHTNSVEYLKGYGDPTYLETKRVSHKSDIYSFGILLFKILCGRKSIIDEKDDLHTLLRRDWVRCCCDEKDDNHLAQLAITHYREKKFDNIIHKDLWKQMDLHSFNMFAEIAYECLDEERSRRPNIGDIVSRLEKALELARENRPIVEHNILTQTPWV